MFLLRKKYLKNLNWLLMNTKIEFLYKHDPKELLECIFLIFGHKLITNNNKYTSSVLNDSFLIIEYLGLPFNDTYSYQYMRSFHITIIEKNDTHDDYICNESGMLSYSFSLTALENTIRNYKLNKINEFNR